jgi:hypothetical protein
MPGVGTITDNTVTGSILYEGALYIGATGIQGGNVVRGNIVQTETNGITGASVVHHNTLLNDSISIVGNDVTENLVYASPTYIDPYCSLMAPEYVVYPPTCSIPTVAIQLESCENQVLRNNSVLNVGIGLEGVDPELNFAANNLFAGVTTTSTSCTPDPSQTKKRASD